MTRRKLVKRIALALLVLVVLAASAALYVIGPRNVVGMLLYDRRQEGTLRVGDRAPDLELTDLDGRTQPLLAFGAGKPLIVIFGSYT